MIALAQAQFRSAACSAALVAALVLFGAGCSTLTRSEPVPGAPPGTKIVKLTGFKFAETPPDPRTAATPAPELEASLRRIVVRYSGLGGFAKSDPQPLLSELQISELAQILAAQLPTMTVQQRLHITFADRHFGSGYDVEMDVYREGIFLVSRFTSLATYNSQNLLPGETPHALGYLQAQPGQEVANRDTLAWVKDPLVADVREARAAADMKKALLEEAKDKEFVSKDEAKRLEPLTERPTPSVDVWKAYWDKRRTLKKAFEQNLMDRAAYDTQVAKLNADLER